MVLKNRKTGNIICKDLKIAESLLDRMFGLLIKSNPRNILFKTRFGIHTFFLREPIDVIILDKNFKIVKLKPGFKPNRFFFWPPYFNTVIELPSQTISNFRLKNGSILEIHQEFFIDIAV